jgi:hypothetical protein
MNNIDDIDISLLSEEDIQRWKQQEECYQLYKSFEESLREYCKAKFGEWGAHNHQCVTFASVFCLGLLKEIAIKIPDAAKYIKSRTLHLEMQKTYLQQANNASSS